MKGALVALRPLRPDDANDLFAVASDPLIWEQHPIRDRYTSDVFSTFFRQSLASRGALRRSIIKMAKSLDRRASMPTITSIFVFTTVQKKGQGGGPRVYIFGIAICEKLDSRWLKSRSRC